MSKMAEYENCYVVDLKISLLGIRNLVNATENSEMAIEMTRYENAKSYGNQAIYDALKENKKEVAATRGSYGGPQERVFQEEGG